MLIKSDDWLWTEIVGEERLMHNRFVQIQTKSMSLFPRLFHPHPRIVDIVNRLWKKLQLDEFYTIGVHLRVPESRSRTVDERFEQLQFGETLRKLDSILRCLRVLKEAKERQQNRAVRLVLSSKAPIISIKAKKLFGPSLIIVSYNAPNSADESSNRVNRDVIIDMNVLSRCDSIVLTAKSSMSNSISMLRDPKKPFEDAFTMPLDLAQCFALDDDDAAES